MSGTTEHANARDDNDGSVSEAGHGERDVRTEDASEGHRASAAGELQDPGEMSSEAMPSQSARTGGSADSASVFTADSTSDGHDPVDQAMNRLREADPGNTQEVLDAGNEANDRLQERLRETAPE